jgi:hypothetical protein
MDLLSRIDAIRLTTANIDKTVRDEMGIIIEKINNAVHEGKYETEINFHISTSNRDCLIERGYLVCVGSQLDLPYTFIRW